MKMKSPINLFLILTILFSCNLKKKDNTKFDFGKQNWRTIELNSKNCSRDLPYIKFMRNHITELEKFDTGFNGQAIRLWYEYPQDKITQKDNPEDVITFKKNVDKNWQAIQIRITRNFNAEGDVISFNKKITDLGNPACKWKNFIDSLLELKIASLPDMDNSSHSLETNGSNPLTIEVVQDNFYRLYEYSNPEDYRTKSWEAENICKMMELIERQFSFKRIIKY